MSKVKFLYWSIQYYCLIMQTDPYPDPNFYSNIRDETSRMNKYATEIIYLYLIYFKIQKA